MHVMSKIFFHSIYAKFIIPQGLILSIWKKRFPKIAQQCIVPRMDLLSNKIHFDFFKYLGN